jgi:hypothetical protein
LILGVFEDTFGISKSVRQPRNNNKKGGGCIVKYSPYCPPTTHPSELTIGPRCNAHGDVHVHPSVTFWSQLKFADHAPDEADKLNNGKFPVVHSKMLEEQALDIRPFFFPFDLSK